MSHAIHTVADLGILRVELETDSQLVAEALDMPKRWTVCGGHRGHEISAEALVFQVYYSCL